MTTEPYRLLILGDFAAREHRGLSNAAALGERKPRRVDRDDLDAVIAALAPEVNLALEPGSPPIVVRVSEIDDFHPDHLVERVSEFQQLRDLRSDIANRPSGSSANRPPSPARPASAESAAVNLGSGSVLDMILDAQAGAPDRTVARPRDELSEYVDQAVRRHAAPVPTADQETLIKQVDDVIVATMRVVLHHPAFQANEALWRGVSFLVRRVDTDESVRVYVLDVTKTELAAAVSGSDEQAARSLRKILRGEVGGVGPVSLVIGAYSFAPDETALIASVAGMARTAGVPWISAAGAKFAGISSFGESADPDDWDATPIPGWEAFRRTDDAHWIALALPRILLRVPYGARSDECSAIRFEETDHGELAHGHFLWGNAAFLCAVLAGEAAASESEPPTHGDVDGLPLFIGTVDGLAEVKPCAEAALGQRAIVHLLDRGLTAIASQREGDAVRIPRLQSVALPPARLASPSLSSDR